VCVGDVPERGEVALDPGQVLEVGARRDEERVEAATGEQLTEPLAPSRVLVRVDSYEAATAAGRAMAKPTSAATSASRSRDRRLARAGMGSSGR
jgi:hypothetical protein